MTRKSLLRLTVVNPLFPLPILDKGGGVMSLRVASYNIHGWVDADMESNLERVTKLVNHHDPDVLCLQEVYPCWEMPCLIEFLRKVNYHR